MTLPSTNDEVCLKYKNETKVITTNIYLSSITILVVAAAMNLSSCQEVWQIPYKTSLVVLSNSGPGGVASCQNYGGSQVYSAGISTVDMLKILNTAHLLLLGIIL